MSEDTAVQQADVEAPDEPIEPTQAAESSVSAPEADAEDDRAATGVGSGDTDSTDTDSADTEDADGSGDDEDDEGGGSVLDTEGEIAADYLEELLDIADFDGDIDTYVESNRAHVSILTEGDVLVGPDGKVLEALQELSRLAVMTETGNRSRLMLDVGGYRDRRRKVLVDLANDTVAEVKTSGQSARLDPMNPFERKIIHDVVAGAGLTSESEGEEPGRRVVVLPKA